MTEIKDSIKKIQVASAALGKNIQQPLTNENNIRSLHNVLTEISENVEALKVGVSSVSDSPIRFKPK